MDSATLYILLACALGLFMAFGVGANDLANVVSTAIGSKSISVKQAVLIAVVFEVAGALLGGGHVLSTIQKGIIDLNDLQGSPHVLMLGVLSVLMAGATWMFLASTWGFPVSVTNTIIGSLVGFGWLVLGSGAVHWQKVRWIALSWVSSPLLACLIAFLFITLIQRTFLLRRLSQAEMQRKVALYLFFISLVLSLMTLNKALSHFHVHCSTGMHALLIIGFSTVLTTVGLFWIRRLEWAPERRLRLQFAYIERVFSVLMFFSVCAMVFAHGSNDVAVAVGPVILIARLAMGGAALSNSWLCALTLLGCFGVIVGLLVYGRRVIATVGSGITTLTPSRGVAATLAAAGTVVLSTGTGIPVSATQTLVGAVFGVGLAGGVGALNLRVIRNILLSWAITIPAGSVLTMFYYSLIQHVL